MPAPFQRRLAQHCNERAPVRLVAAVRGLEDAQPLENRLALFGICLAQLRLGLEVFAARLVRALRRLMKPLPVRVRVAADALAHGLPVFLQLTDAPRERLRLQCRTD